MLFEYENWHFNSRNYYLSSNKLFDLKNWYLNSKLLFLNLKIGISVQKTLLSLTIDILFYLGVSEFVHYQKCLHQGKKMVEDTSAQRGANNNYILLEDCDHFTVCKPFDKSHPSYYKLVEFIRSCQQEVSSIDSINPFAAFLLIMNFADLFNILGYLNFFFSHISN